MKTPRELEKPDARRDRPPGTIGEDATTVEIKRDGCHLLVLDHTSQNHAEVTAPISDYSLPEGRGYGTLDKHTD